MKILQSLIGKWRQHWACRRMVKAGGYYSVNEHDVYTWIPIMDMKQCKYITRWWKWKPFQSHKQYGIETYITYGSFPVHDEIQFPPVYQ